MALDQATIKTLAEANGLTIPDNRLERVLQQYQSFLRTLERLDSVPLERGAEPDIIFSLEPEASGPATPRGGR